jgi:hypothetical protein
MQAAMRKYWDLMAVEQRHGQIRHNIHNSYLTLHLKSLEFRVGRKEHNSTVHLG